MHTYRETISTIYPQYTYTIHTILIPYSLFVYIYTIYITTIVTIGITIGITL